MQEPIQPNPDIAMPTESEGLDAATQEVLDWLTNTPEGRELSERAKTNPELLNDYARWQAEGETHEESLQSWKGVPRRIARDIKEIPGEFDKIRRDPFGGITQHYEQRLESAGVTSHAGALGLVAFDVIWGTIAGTVDAVYDISRGQFDAEQVAHAGSVLVPWSRAMLARGLASQLAKKTVVGAGTNYFVPKHIWDEVVKELEPRDLARLERAKILDKSLQTTETGMEVASLTLESDEWVHELVGMGLMRGIAETSASIFRTKGETTDQPLLPDAETPPALPPGQPQLPEGQPQLPEGQPQLPGEPDSEPIALGPDAGVEPEPTTPPDVIPLGPTAGVEPEIEPEVTPDVEPEVVPEIVPEPEIEPEVTPEVTPPPEPTNPLHGTPHRTVYSSDRKQSFGVEYRLMELDEVVASHLLDGKENPLYVDPDLQPREERGGIPSLKKVEDYAREMKTPFYLDPFATTSDGAPILSFKNPPLVLSGNGRTMSLQKAYRDHPESWQKYQDALRETAEQYGITPDQIESMQKPILVQMLLDEVDESMFADDANQQTGLAYTSTETATSDARYLTDDVMSYWSMTGESFDAALESAENQDFRAALLKQIPESRHPRFLTPDLKNFSSDGVKRLRNMLMRYVFQGDYGMKLSQMLIDTKFDSITNIQNMLDVALPQLALIESYTRSGLRETNLSIAEELARAVGTLDDLSRNGESVWNFAAQDMLFKPQTVIDQLSEPAMLMLVLLEGKQNAFQQLASVFARYTAAVMDEPLPGEALFSTGFTKAGFFEPEIRKHFENKVPPEIQKWVESEEQGDKEKKIQPRKVGQWEIDERITAYVDTLLGGIRGQVEVRSVLVPQVTTFTNDAIQRPGPRSPASAPERTGVEPPAVSPDLETATTSPEKEITIAGVKHSFKQAEANEFPRGWVQHIVSAVVKDARTLGHVSTRERPVSGKDLYGQILAEGELKPSGVATLETDNPNSVYFTPTPLQGYRMSDSYGFILDAEQMLQDGIVGIQDNVGTLHMGDYALQRFRDDARYAPREPSAPALKNMGTHFIVASEGSVDINKYLVGVIENGQAYTKTSDSQGALVTPPDIEVPSVVGAEPEITPEGVELTAPEPRQPPPNIPKNPNLKLIDITPTGTAQNAESIRTYTIEERPDIEIRVSAAEDGYYVDVLVPGYNGEPIWAPAPQGDTFNDTTAKQAINTALESERFRSLDWQLNPNDPFLNRGVEAPTEAEQARIDKMSVLKQSKKFKDLHTSSRRGVAFEMPGLDPAMKMKTFYERGGLYGVYLESEAFAEELEGYELHDGLRVFYPAEGNQSPALMLGGIPGVDPMDALKRGLARVLDDSVWDGLNKPPEPNVPSNQGSGFPGNQPPPLPDQIQLGNAIMMGLGEYTFDVADVTGTAVKGYQVQVKEDPFGLADGTMEVTLNFPGFDVEPLQEFVTAETAEEAALQAISAWREFEWSKGGLGMPEGATPQHTPIEEAESLMESLPPVVKSSERPFGKMSVDTQSMEIEGLAKTGVMQVYKFAASHAPQVRVRQMGDTWNVEIRYPRHNAAHHVSYKETHHEAIQEAIKVTEASDHAWKPLYKTGVFAEIDGLINAVNRRQFATTPAIERRLRGLFANLRKGVSVDLRGYKVSSLKELAILGQVFRNPKFEAHRIFYLSANHEIVGHDSLSFGIPGLTGTVPQSRIFYQMRKLGAKHFVDFHNHPSGSTMLSKYDKLSSKDLMDTYGDEFLGSVIVNSGEYSESIPTQDKHGKWYLQSREKRRLTSADVGWDTGVDPPPENLKAAKEAHRLSWSPLEETVRPADPMFQYDVNTVDGKLVETARSLGRVRGEIIGKQDKAVHSDIAKFGKYLQTEFNWTTLFFTNFSHEIIAAIDYKDLHRLESNQLWDFVNGEARKHGGVYVSAYVGEGDWYDTHEDVENSAWGALMSESAGESEGIEHFWFAGLAGKGEYAIQRYGALSINMGRQMLNIHDEIAAMDDRNPVKGKKPYTPRVDRMQSGIIESQSDADYGIDTGLTEPSVPLEKLKTLMRAQLANGQDIDWQALYMLAFNKVPAELKERAMLVYPFVQMMTNQLLFNIADLDVTQLGTTEAGDFYDTVSGLEAASGVPWLPQVHRGTAYAMSRLANITEKDTVLTMSDKDGMLATFARLANAGNVATTAADGYTRKLLDQLLPGLTETHAIEETNVARQWEGNRPTVILIDGHSAAESQIDEAMKILAPNGRAVVAIPDYQYELMSRLFWHEIGYNKYQVRDFKTKERVAAGTGEYMHYFVIDKRKSTGASSEFGKTEISHDAATNMGSTDSLFAKIEEYAVTRHPVTPEHAAMPFEGTQPEERTFLTPIDNPKRPQFESEPLPLGDEAGPDPLMSDSGGDSPKVVTRMADGGMPVRGMGDTPPESPPPDDTPTGVSDSVRSWVREKFTDTNQKWYPISVQTAKVTLEKLGSTGREIGASLKRVRNVGDRFTGRGTSQLDQIFPKATAWVQGFARDRNLPLTTVVSQFNQMLARHHEGRSVQRVPKVMNEIADTIKSWVTENIENPMLKMNHDILRQGLLFEMPESFVDEGVLTNEYRKELDMDLPNFEKFMRMRKGRAEYGLIQGFVRNKETGKVYAVRVKGDVYADPKTGSARVSQGSVKYMLESPFGEHVEGDSTMLYDANEEYSLMASRNPVSRRWEGGRDAAKQAWDAEIENNPRPDMLAQQFTEAGIQLPPGVRFVFRKVANLEEWSVRKDGAELYRIRRIVPIVVNKKKKTGMEAHASYSPFKSRLLVYDASQARTPIFIYRGATAHKLWQPIPNYFPHIIDWRTMNPDPNSGKKYDRFKKYVERFADSNAMEFDTARAILTQYIADSKTRKYGHLEQDRQFNFPAYNRNYFQVWEQYMARTGHRMQTIREFGQQNDLLTARLNEFVGPDTLADPLSESERSVLKLRHLSGYQDFTPLKKAWKQEFRDDNGAPTILDPNEGEYVGMGPGDWAVLAENGILTALDDGRFEPTEAGVAMLENPAFLHGALLTGMRKISVASDIVKNQLGWRQGDLFDEEMGDMIRGIQGWTGVLFLGRAWAANIAQTVNTAVVLDGKSLLKGFHKLTTDEKSRKWAREVGAVAIDVMHDYGSGSALGTRVLRQMLGAVPRYQMGKSSWRSVLPTEEVIDDFGVKIHAWTPFYHIERMNRIGAALASRAYAVGHIKDMINNPKDAKVAREQLISLPSAYELEGKLKEALSIGGLTVEDVEKVSEMLPDEVREQTPHLWAVHDFLAEFAKETADWTQHRVEAMDRGRPWTNNPIFIMMQQLQSFNIAQTKFVKDQFIREWKVMHTFLNQKDLPSALQGKGASRALGSLWLFPRILMWGGIFGVPTAVLGKLIRFDAPDEDTIGLATGLYKAGMFTQLGEYMLQIQRWNRGAEEILLGPTLGTIADIAGDIGQGKPLRTVSRLARPPLGGPSMKQIIDWTKPEEGGRPPRRNQRGRPRQPRQTRRRE